MAKYVDNKRQWNQTKRLSKAASSLKIYPNSSEWHKLYFAVGLCSGSVQIYNINHKISFSSPRIKSDILSLAFSLHVSHHHLIIVRLGLCSLYYSRHTSHVKAEWYTSDYLLS